MDWAALVVDATGVFRDWLLIRKRQLKGTLHYKLMQSIKSM